jgi:putative membrane protein
MKNYLQWMIKGLAMGAADVVPGVSGGTLAFILGIYSRLLGAISSVNITAARLLLRGRFKTLWQYIDGTFLLCLFSGILLSIFSLANGIGYLLEHRPVPLWAFFNGLILASLPILLRSVNWSAKRALLCGCGILFAVAIGMLAPVQFEPAPYMFFLAGAIAICAMILPGISGSFILLILGMYGPVMLAVTEMQLGVIALFASGCLIGLLSFSRLLNWLLKHYHDETLALLIGVVIGALYRIWPWQHNQQMISPWHYQQQVGNNDLLLAVGALIAGVIMITLLMNLGRLFNNAEAEKA